MSWNGVMREWRPEGFTSKAKDHLYTHFLLTSPENLRNVVDWLEKISPPWIVTVICLDRTEKGMGIYQIAAAEGQSWGLLMVNKETLIAFANTHLPAYMDSRMRRPWWQRRPTT